MYANLIELHPTYQLDQHSIRLIWKDAASANKGVSLHSKKNRSKKNGEAYVLPALSHVEAQAPKAKGAGTPMVSWRNPPSIRFGEMQFFLVEQWPSMAPTFGRYWYWRPLGSLLSKSPTWWKLSSPEWKQVGFFGLTDQTKILERPRWPVSPRMVAIIQVATAFRWCPEA